MKTDLNKGSVYLVGAGPGDPELMTIKGMKCLQQADVVVYDYHLNAQLLDFARLDAELIYAGKQSGHHAMTQDEINSVLITSARKNKIVCRLKGGDPFVFGRGGEEAEALVEAGIPFEVVPGVSSAIAAAAYAGIPLTHRKYSSSFAVIPGSETSTRPGSRINWSKLATGVETLVFLMAVENIENVTNALIQNGRAPDTLVAVVRRGTRIDQATIVGTLGSIAGLMRSQNIKPPAVVIVGEVVRLRERLKWFEALRGLNSERQSCNILSGVS
jgi:uroporphyrinogen III methyltransferase/synthase